MRIVLTGIVTLTMVIAGLTQGYTNVRPINGVGNEFKITAFALDKSNNKFIATNSGLVKVSAQGNVETIYSGGPVHAVEWHPREGLWIAIEGNKVFNPNTKVEIVLEGEDVQISSMDFSGANIWCGTNNGAYVISTSNAKVTDHFTPENSKLPVNTINDIYIDDSRIKWIGTGSGVVRVEDKKWKLYEKEEAILAITGNSEGIWIAAQDEMWLVDPFNRWTATGASEDLSTGPIRALAADKKGKIYILSDVLVQFDPYTDIHIEIDNDYTLQSGNDVAIMFDLEDNLWVGSLEHGLVAMDMAEAEELPLSGYFTVNHPKCSGDTNGSLSITATGGQPPYTIAWETVEASGKMVTDLGAGIYRATLTDINGTSVELKAELIDPDPLRLVIRDQVESESVRAVVSGGAGGYTYSWSHGASTSQVTSLSPGPYEVVVTDGKGCEVSEMYTQPEPAVELTDASGIDAVDVAVLKTLDAATLEVGQTLRIEQLYFEADSSTMTSNSNDMLDEVYSFLNSNERIVIEIGGHTNGLPEHDYCDRLSTARAQSVADYLYSKGIPQNRIAFKGYGKRNPVATNSTVAGRRKNQRVEIKILEI